MFIAIGKVWDTTMNKFLGIAHISFLNLSGVMSTITLKRTTNSLKKNYTQNLYPEKYIKACM